MRVQLDYFNLMFTRLALENTFVSIFKKQFRIL